MIEKIGLVFAPLHIGVVLRHRLKVASRFNFPNTLGFGVKKSTSTITLRPA